VRLAYLFSRYPVISQTFIDTEMLALERAGVELEIFSIYPPPTSFRHGHAARLRAPIQYAPPQSILKLGEQRARAEGRWPEELIAAHDRKYGPAYKAALRARNALYFADLFRARGFTHFHVHFANRAAHTALFVKALSGLPFSMSTHGQDYMVDLGNHDLLREICAASEFVANETEWSTGELRKLCPDSAGKMVRVFNGMDLANFAETVPGTTNGALRIVSTGRLIEFKGFHHLIAACATLRERGLDFTCDIIGEGPWRERLQQAIDAHGAAGCVRLRGALPQEEVFAALRAADVFALPCIVDANGASDVFPTVILEAMASARPVVSTRIAGVPEQIVHGETGFICEPGDERGLADALEKLLRSSELRREFGAAGQRRLRSEFAVDRTVQALRAQYEKVVASSATPAASHSGLAVLLTEWPAPERHEAELVQLAGQIPEFRAYVVAAGALPVAESWRRTLPHCDFLPDAMVVEGEWQQRKDLRHRAEVLRGEAGTKFATEDFLRHARHAVALLPWLRRDGIRHVHAASARELPLAWLLRRLTGVTMSASLDDKSPLHEDTAVLFAKDCAGLRLARGYLEEKLAASDKSGPFVLNCKSGRGFEPEWLARLKTWSSA
jgi:glycosyltransferase involved in cell wall biosynthesis